MKNNHCDKLILAVLQGDEFRSAIAQLNEHGFYATVIHSAGGFLRKQSVTIMIGLNHEHLDEAITVLKAYGRRVETEYQPMTLSGGSPAFAGDTIPVPVSKGGVVLFVLDVDQYARY